MSEIPETRYATTSDGLHIAYQSEGLGPFDLIELSNGTLFSIDATAEQPRWQNYVDRISLFARFIRFDLRGIGLSDPVGSSDPPTVEQWANDSLAVLDAEGVARTAVVGVSFGGLAALLLAATHPDRIGALILVNSYARLLKDNDYPVGVPHRVWQRFSEAVIEPGPLSSDDLPVMAPGMVSDAEFSSWWRRAGHRGASPASAWAVWLAAAADVRSILGTLQLPTLVIQTRDNQFVRAGHGRYLAEHIPNARYVELESADHVPWTAEADFVGEIEEFLTGERQLAPTSRLLATVLFTDIVDSTQHTADMGDQAWKERLELHDRAIDRLLARFGGRLVKRTGDGALATFDGPARAVQCATAIRSAINQLGLSTRAGLHTGEIEQRGDDVAGIAVHIAQRVQGMAQPDEVVVSRTVVELVVGSGLQFRELDECELRGVPGRWLLYAVTS